MLDIAANLRMMGASLRINELTRLLMTLPLMPKATAVWLVENTTLTFDQIAEFCGLHPLEVQGIADGDVATGLIGENPVENGQLDQAELDKAIEDSTYKMVLAKDYSRESKLKRHQQLLCRQLQQTND